MPVETGGRGLEGEKGEKSKVETLEGQLVGTEVEVRLVKECRIVEQIRKFR